MSYGSPFSPISPQERAISDLFVAILIIGGIVFALVTVLVLVAIVRFRHRPGQEGEPRQEHGRRPLEIAWTVGPVVLLAVILVFTVKAMAASDPSPGDRPPDLIITGYQWWWGIQYPGAGVVTANEIHLPAGKRSLIQLDAADVIHDFWVPQLGPKKDMIPGKSNFITVEPMQPGTYLGACAEFCGPEHAWMLIRVIVQPRADFDDWLRQQARPHPAPAAGDAAQGAGLFQQLTCATCHAVAGTAANARVGPDLTHFGSRATLGAGVRPNTPDDLAAWLRDPQGIKPQCHMPNLQLTDDQVRALVAYLESQ